MKSRAKIALAGKIKILNEAEHLSEIETVIQDGREVAQTCNNFFNAWKVFKYAVVSGPYFPLFEGKYGPEKKSLFGHFLRSDFPNIVTSLKILFKENYETDLGIDNEPI